MKVMFPIDFDKVHLRERSQTLSVSSQLLRNSAAFSNSIIQ